MARATTFRPDVEGLRALAIIAVLAFHHQWGSFSGGFIGVDVFFVISGYLITRNILSEVHGGGFSFKAFYMRRARRLFPAMFFTVASTLLVGAFIASPNDLRQIAASSMASIFSVSNVYFWSQSGYFDTEAIQNPLLHTWSLAVEEQFYFVWPILVLLIARYASSQRVAVSMLAVLGGISIWVAERNMAEDVSGTFYLTHYRISEFALGAICAWVPHRSHKGLEGEVFSVLGLGMIAYPIFSYSDATPFPGLSALLPCLGAAMLIFFNGGGVSRWILTNPVAGGIGRISYSLYLAHWPIYVMYRQWKGNALDVQETVIVSAVSLVCATAMYKYVEQPFRARGANHAVTVTTRSFAKLFASLTCGLLIVSASVWSGDGWAWRYSANVVQVETPEAVPHQATDAAQSAATQEMATRQPPNGHGKNAALYDETRHARFSHPASPPVGEGANESLREFHVDATPLEGRKTASPQPVNLVQLVNESDAERKNRFKPYLKRCRTLFSPSCEAPVADGVNIFVIGDSHASDAFNALVEQYPRFHYIFYGLAGCPPLAREDFKLLTVKHPNRDACIASNEKLLYGNQLVEADIVVINTVFQWYKPEHLTHSIAQIRKATNAPIMVLGNYLFFTDDLADFVVKHGVTKMDSYYAERLDVKTFAYENELESLSKTLGFTYVSKKRLFCNGDSVLDCPIMFEGKLFTYDKHHLSIAAAKYLGYELRKSHGDIFKQLESRSALE